MTATLELPQDYSDLLVELSEAGADYLLIGGWAVAVHGHGRATDDMDILVRPSGENAAKVFLALKRFGAPLDQHGVTENLFSAERYAYRIGRKPMLIEILTCIDGVDFEEAKKDAVVVEVDGKKIPVIGRAALLKNKRASARPKDLADIDALEALEDRDEP